MGANETGKNKIGESMAIEDGAGGPDVVATKSLEMPVGSLRGLYMAFKILEVYIRGLGGVTKSGKTIVERWETPADSGIQVPMASNLNNPTLVSLSLASSRLGIGKGMSMSTSSIALCCLLDPLSSFDWTFKTISRLQEFPQDQKFYCATLESSNKSLDNTQKITLYNKFFTAKDNKNL